MGTLCFSDRKLSIATWLRSARWRDLPVHRLRGSGARYCDRGCKYFSCSVRWARCAFQIGSCPLPHGFARRVGGIFQFTAFVAQVPDIAIAAVNIFLALFDGHVVLFRSEVVHCHMASLGALAGSSSSPPSWLRCQILRSRL